MTRHQVPFENLSAPPTFKTDDIIMVNGSPDRHRWRPLDLGFCDRCAEPTECLMDSKDQSRQIDGGDLVFSDVGGDNLGRKFLVARRGLLLVSHALSPVLHCK
jgi:hypothetical protein